MLFKRTPRRQERITAGGSSWSAQPAHPRRVHSSSSIRTETMRDFACTPTAVTSWAPSLRTGHVACRSLGCPTCAGDLWPRRERENQTRKLHRPTDSELRWCILKTLRQLNELGLQRERSELSPCLDRNIISVRDPQHERPRRLPKLLHCHDSRVVCRDTVSRKGRSGALWDVC